ncbi:MAG TPA: RNA 2',3'-cyclic phosphodiesterase [Bacillota bacterium]|nr:RNA 2',3'-cyclic phosphodiesterase [Bacillota bacterium]
MRLFTAILFNEEIKDHLTEAIQKLKKQSAKGNFTFRDNLHLTLVFLGEVGEDKVGAVKAAMDQVHGEPFRLAILGFGKFRKNGGDIHWAGAEKSEALLSLREQLAAELEKEGFSLEDRAYSPHLTLGRQVRLTAPGEMSYGPLELARPEMKVSKLSLMKSERIDGKLVYTEIYKRNLGT